MHIEWQVRAIQGKIVFKSDPQLTAEKCRDGLESVPEQAVVNDEKINAAFRSESQSPGRGIDRCSDFPDLAGVLYLEPVQSVVPVSNLADVQCGITQCDDLL